MAALQLSDRPRSSGPPHPTPAARLGRLLAGSATLPEHLASHGAPSWPGADRGARQDLIELVDRSGLRGRGGAAFPTALKLAAVAGQKGAPLVVGNGTEGEPASMKDRMLMARSPHLVLDGAVLAARAVGAREAVIVCHPAVREVVERAVAERRACRFDPVCLRAVDAAEGFVAGEASAVVHWLEKRGATPTRTPPRLAECGLHGRPTLVQNVETLAQLALVCRYGAEWFRSVGTEREPGSVLATLLGAVEHPGVYEVALGTPVSELLQQAGGSRARPQALLLGGYFGSWVNYEEAAGAPFSQAGLAPLGAAPGAGLVVVLAAGSCGLAETARVVRYLAGQSAGQCGPCAFGLPAIAGELDALSIGGQFDRVRIERWLGQVDGRGACRHPDGVVRMVRSAFTVFAGEIDRHARGRCCSPGPATASPVLPVPGDAR